MPNTYAHYCFGQEIVKLLQDDTQKLIEKHKDIFNIGVHGPDIYSFYHTLFNDKMNKLCSREHANSGLVIMEHAATCIREDPAHADAYFAYMYGMICHLVLDGYCHGFVNSTRDTKGIAHNLQESEFDRMLMKRDGKDPFSYCPGNTLVTKWEYAERIAYVSMDVDARIVKKSVQRMRKWCNFFVAPTFFHRAIIYFGLWISGNYKKRTGMILKHKENPKCVDTNKELLRLYEKAKILAVHLIEEYRQNVYEGKAYSSAYNVCFSPKTSVETILDASLNAS
ncbi:MAG: zinc dependent phospholipase C family protein [Eubacteriales bacterium]|nr:zinc dependent phospholipase C family protein [Lachnospiraceae bacterium]MDO5127242.1 zinc dependent phospholipase C family protein [Eubacteriales bacterium]